MQAPEFTPVSKTSPLLRWAGGKRRLLPHILPLVPAVYNHYYEPFFGGGAVFFALSPIDASLSDLNAELISCYAQVRDKPEEVISYLQCLTNSEADYYKIRDNYPLTVTERAARLIYLSVLSFNGIYRQNRHGVFNVPYGHRSHVNPCDEKKIRATSKALSQVRLASGDFEEMLNKAKMGDLVYLDPPYTLAHQSNGFVLYNDKIFSWKDQQRLAEIARHLKDEGCHVVVSNADHESIHDLYSDFNCKIVTRTSIIAASSDKRRAVTECIFYNRI